jgi:hypothetical protein
MKCRQKASYPTHAAATYALHHLDGRRSMKYPIAVYLCHCGQYHLTSRVVQRKR